MSKQIKVIALEWNVPMLIDVLAELSTQHDWQPVYCVSFQLEERVKQHFPDAIYHETHDARYGRPPAALADLPWSGIDQPLAEALGYAGLLALKQMDRMEIMGGFASHDRFLHLHRLASYWSAVMDRLQPDVLLMPTAPHVVYDYIAYSIAKHRGIRTVMFEYVTTEGLLMAIDRFEDGLPPLTAAYRAHLATRPAGSVPLSARMEAYWQRLRGSYSDAIPQATRMFLARANAVRAAQAEERKTAREIENAASSEATRRPRDDGSETGAGKRSNPLLRVLGLTGARKPLGPAPAAGETRQLPLPSGAPPTTEGHHAGRFYTWSEVPVDLARSAARYHSEHVEAIVRRYDELAVTPDLGQPFVYVPLHHQPERATNPNGGIFDDQDALIGMIAAALPAGWRIYVKEHPSQFAPQVASERGRWVSFYDAVVAHPNVEFVTLQTPSFDLIDNARAVATITGTSSWEAVVRGVPTLVFGEAWFKGCPGSYTVRAADDCRKALGRIAHGERHNVEDLRRFLKVAEETAFVGYLGPDDLPVEGTDEATNIARLTTAIAECYQAANLAE